MRCFHIMIYLLLLGPLVSYGQKFERLDITFSSGQSPISMPLTGGISTPCLSNVDLNNDAIQDLYVFDREGNVNLTFLSDGSSFKFAPEYSINFPECNSWVLLRDYNQDGVMDLFTSNEGTDLASIRVFIGEIVDDKITFSPFLTANATSTELYFTSEDILKPIFVGKIDMPSISDIDCDGDLDIISFQQEGNYVTFYQNQSIELGYGLDSLIFTEQNDCWGGFFENGLAGELKLAASPDDCADELLTNDQDDKSFLHPGSAILAFDLDNDQDQDLLLSNVGFPDVSLLRNAGDCSKAWMNEYAQNFPVYDTIPNLGSFPAMYKVDLDHDQIDDLVYAPNFVSNSDSRSTWFYKNTSSNETPIYNLKNKNFLAEQMIDLGLSANPTFVDYNADGLLDIIVGNLGYRLANGGLEGRLFLFENIGTKTAPSFNLIDDDYLGFSRFFGQARDFAPTFEDMDNDGDLDLIVGTSFGKILFAENIAGPNATFEFGEINTDWFRIRAGQITTPFVFDMNGDSINDLLIGERVGNINYYQNIGTSENPDFLSNPDTSPNISFVGRIDTRQTGMFTGTSAPVLLNVEGVLHLITGSEQGALEMYEVNLEDLSSEFEAKSLNLGDIDEGFITRPSIADINDDGWYDILVGNKRGGISLYTSNLRSRPDTTTSLRLIDVEYNMKVFPSPARDQFYIETEQWQNIQQAYLIDINGQVLQNLDINSQHTTISTHTLKAGLYFIKVSDGFKQIVKKIIVM